MKTTTFSLRNALRIDSFVRQLSLIFLFFASFAISQGLKAQTILFEDFETTGSLPGALPAGWGTSQTDVTGNGIENSFQIWNSQTVNSVGYFPAPERGNNNRFAAMRNENADCNCSNDTAYVETPLIDLSESINPALRFNIFNPDLENFDEAWVSASTDEGVTWQIIGYIFESDTVIYLADHPDDWKSIALNLAEYTGISNVKIRFYWRNEGTSTLLSPIDYLGSGYAIDNVTIDEFDNFNITNERTHIANVYSNVMSAPYVPYTMIPLNQVYPVSCNSMVYNTGLSELNNIGIFAEIFKQGISQGTWTSPLTDSLNVLNKVDISITTGYTPDAVGQYEIRSSAFCSEDETNLSDNESTTRFAVTECTYANDYGDAYGSYQLNADEYGGNVFHVVQSDIFSSIQVAIHEKTPIGATIQGRVYEFDSLNPVNGEPIFIPVANGFTSSHLIVEGDLTTTTNTKFICLPFENGISLDGAKSYLFAVECDTTFYISFSGGNDVNNINTLVYSESEAKFFERRKTMMVRAIGSCSEPCLTENPAGCTNPDACNYNSLALVDDGTCLILGSSCDDGNICTIEDVINTDCVCRGFGVCQPNILEPSFNCNDGFFQLSLNIQVDPQSVQNTLIVESSNGGYSILPPTLSTYNYVYLGQYPADGQPITIYAYFAEGGGIDTLFTQAPGCCIGYNYDFAFESIYPIVPAPIEYNVCIENTAPALVFDVATNLSLTYQWYLVAPNGGTAMIQGATASTFSPQTNEVSTISYFCIGTYYEGCSVTSSTYAVNVIDGSDFIGSSQDLTICPGYNAVLFPHLSVRGGNVIWANIPAFSFNNGYSLTVTPIQTTEYPFTYTLGDCINYSDTITVEVLPLPSIQVTPSSSCSADPVTLTATVSEPGGSFLWSTGETNSSIVVSANQTTTYTVEYTAPGCTPTENTCYDPELADFCAEQNPWIACPTCFADFLPYAFEICTCDNQTAIVESCNGYIIYRNGNCESQNEISVSASATIYPQALSSCNDGDPCTVNDIIQSDCTCSGTLLDENQNGVCDLEENCNITAIPNPICEGDTSTLSLGINNYENRVAQFTNSLQQRVIIPYTYSATSVIDNFAYELWVNTSRSITLLPEKTGGINVQAVNGQNFAVFPSYYLNPNLRGTGISVGTNGLSIVEHSGNFFASRFTYATSLIGWHHIAVSYINNGFNVYLDGQFIGYRPNGTNFFNNHNRVAPLMALGIGYPGSDPMANSNYDPNDNYSGLMDNFRLWNRTLTGSEINLLFDKGLESSNFDGNYVNITFDEGNCDNQTTVNPPVVIELDNGPSSYPFLSTPVFQYIEGNSFNDFTVNQYQSPYDILWSTGENSTSISVAPSVTTTYSVTVNQNGQICTDDIIIEVIPAETYYLDADGDNFGNPDVPLLSCEGAPNGYVSDNTDCNDDEAAIYPGAPCDDFDLTTYNDLYNSECLCAGTSISNCNEYISNWQFSDNTALTVCFTGNHTWVSDLSFYLVGPPGCGSPQVLLSEHPDTTCNGGNGFYNFCFSRNTSLPFNVCTAPTPLTGNYGAYSDGSIINWSALDGCDVHEPGWSLQIYDCIDLDTGTLNSGEILISETNASGDTASIQLYLPPGFNSPIIDSTCNSQDAPLVELQLETSYFSRPFGNPCNDNDPCTINDVINTECTCQGTFIDSDNDGICDYYDLALSIIVISDTTLECGTFDSIDLPYTVIGGCSTPQVSYSDQIIDPNPCLTIIERTWIASDNCGNVATLITTINVVDTTAPVFVTIPEGGTYSCEQQVPFLLPVVSDNCDSNPVISVVDHAATILDCNSSYTYYVTFVAIDNCGNTATADVYYTIIDDTPPVFSSENQTDFYFNLGEPISLPIPIAFDNCSDNVTVYQGASPLDEIPTELWLPCNTYSQQWIAIDECGNTSFFTQNIHIGIDPNAPPIPCDDNNPCTINDVINIDCDCVGSDVCSNYFDISTQGCEADFYYIVGRLFLANPSASTSVILSNNCGYYEEFSTANYNPTFGIYFTISSYPNQPESCSLIAQLNIPGLPIIAQYDYTAIPCCLPPYFEIEPISSLSICQGGTSPELLAVAYSSNYPVTYQWYIASAANQPGTAINGATQSAYTPSNQIIGTRYYYCVATSLTCTNESNICAFTVSEASTTPTFGSFGPYCAGNSIPALPTTSTNGITGTWSPAINNQATTTYTFSPNSGQCASTVSTTIVINPVPVVSLSNQFSCTNGLAAITATVSPAGLYDFVWNVPAGAVNPGNVASFTTNVSGLYSVTASVRCIDPSAINPDLFCLQIYAPVCGCNGVTYGNDCSAQGSGVTSWVEGECTGNENFYCPSAVASTNVTITPSTTPTFGTFGPYCAGDVIPPLPTISTNGITGTWSPAINNQATTTYTFTPNAGQCAQSVSTTITITPLTTPSFTVVNSYCIGAFIPALPTTSNNGITGTWSPAINNQATTTYTFTPNAGQCAQSVSTTITITPLTTPSFTVVNSYCSGTSISALPTTSNNGITGTWSPAINNQATTTYTFTPNAGQCAQSVSTTITITPLTTPTFNAVSAACSGSSIPPLPTTSNNGITGTWSPAINNTQTTNYTFTPNAGQCASQVFLTISILPNTTPTFGNFGPYCADEVIPPLPTISTNGITGIWSPAINNQATITYTFTPNNGQCALSTSTTIVITPQVLPTFNTPSPYCQDSAFPALPTTSNNGVSGTWAPTINNQTTTTYTFTPDADECASSVDVTVSIVPSVTPAFSIANLYCQGESIPALPTTSNNGIAGTWSPAINNQSTTAYVFTPNAGQCASVVTQTINVSAAVNAAITNLSNTTNLSCNTTAITLVATGGTSYAWSGGLGNASVATVTTAGTYTVTVTNGACQATASITITQSPVGTPNAGTDGQTVLCSNDTSTTNLFSFLGGSPQPGGTWSGPAGNLPGGLYNPSVHNEGVYYYIVTDASGCGSDTAQVVVEEETYVQATLSYDSPFCKSQSGFIAPTAISPLQGTFSVSPSSGLVINAEGAINPALSAAGTYSINYEIEGICESQTSALVIIEEIPTNVIPAFVTICPDETETLSAQFGEGYTYLWSNGETSQSIQLNATDAGSYFVTITNDAGCSSSSNTAVVSAGTISPSQITLAGPPSICEGETTSLTASGGSSFEWSTGEVTQTITVDEVGDYWVVITNASGCSDTSETVAITYGNGVTITASGPTTFCEGGSVTLTAEPDDLTFIWATGQSSQSITITESGTYQVQTVNANGCGGSAQIQVTVIPYPSDLSIPSPTLCGGISTTLCASPADEVIWTMSPDNSFQSYSPCITVNEAGMYTATMTNGNLCTTIDSVLVETIAFYVYYQDLDGDGFGTEQDTVHACSAPEGYDSDLGDCDDTDALISPIEMEICNDEIDNNCDSQIDEDCSVVILGCTDPTACPGNYNPEATDDDGSCTYPGCTYPEAINYEPEAGCDDGSCEFVEPIEGCMDTLACNYVANATIPGTCNYPGCMDQNACNFDSNATCQGDVICIYSNWGTIEGEQLPFDQDTIQYSYTNCDESCSYSWSLSNYSGTSTSAGIVLNPNNQCEVLVYFSPNDELLSTELMLQIDCEDGCSEAISLNLIPQPNSIEEVNDFVMSAYPNPTTNNFTLQISEAARGAELMVYDALGKLIEQRPLNQLQTTIESDTWAAGVYTLLLRHDEGASSLRIVKE